MKIVCTLGPSTATESAIGDLLDAGMNVARINFSHGTHAEHAATIARVRAAADARKLPVAILGDLQGPRIRIGDLSSPSRSRPAMTSCSHPEDALPAGAIPVTYHPLASDVHTGDRSLVDDGLIELMVLDTAGDTVHAGGARWPDKKSQGSEPARHPRLGAFDHRERPRRHHFCRRAGSRLPRAELCAEGEDIADLQERIQKKLLVIAKIEKDIALTNIESIMRAADGVMVARG